MEILNRAIEELFQPGYSYQVRPSIFPSLRSRASRNLTQRKIRNIGNVHSLPLPSLFISSSFGFDCCGLCRPLSLGQSCPPREAQQRQLLFHGPGYKGHVMSHTVHVAWDVMELLERIGASIGTRLHAAAGADDDPGGEATEMLAFGGHDTKGVKEVRLLFLS